MRFSQHFFNICVAVLAIFQLGGQAASAPLCVGVPHRGVKFTVCVVDPAKADMRVFLNDSQGQAYGGFDKLAADIAAQGGKLAFAMNGGMYHPDLRPVGLYIEKSKELAPLNQRAGKGNFGMKPNGVFWIKGRSAGVVEAARYQGLNLKPDFATQSGPMLVIDGRVHPKIHADGTSEKLRNGVGQCEDGKIKFAISEDYVTFHVFATLFSETLKCPQALFLDGSISSLYAPAIGRNDGWKPMGPIIGVVEAAGK